MSEELALLAASIVDVVSGTSTEEQRDRVERWSRERPEHRIMLGQVRRALQPRRPDRRPADVEAIVRAVRQRIDMVEGGGDSRTIGQEIHNGAGRIASRGYSFQESTLGWQKPDWRKLLRGRVLGTRPLRRGGFKEWTLRRYAAYTGSVVAGLVVLLVGWQLGERTSRRPSASMLTYATGDGERATITLPDGGTVALNVASRLEVPLDYMGGHRMVRLTGEGLFTIPHSGGAAFSVTTGTTTARVLGTSFVVRHYGADPTTLISVRDGKVAVGSTVVTANQAVEVGRRWTSSVRPSDPSSFTFATGILTLNGMPFSSALTELGRWYDADIRLGDPTLATQFVKGTFATGSLADLTAILEGAFNVRVVRSGRVLMLYSR